MEDGKKCVLMRKTLYFFLCPLIYPKYILTQDEEMRCFIAMASTDALKKLRKQQKILCQFSDDDATDEI